MTDTTAQEADLLQTAANCLKWVDGDHPLETKQMYTAAAAASTALAAELRVRRGPAEFRLENDDEFEARVRRNHKKWGSSLEPQRKVLVRRRGGLHSRIGDK